MWVWRAWNVLHHERPLYVGLGGAVPGRIPWTAAAAWCEFEGRTAADVEFLWRCFDAMEETFMRVRAEQAKAEAGTREGARR